MGGRYVKKGRPLFEIDFQRMRVPGGKGIAFDFVIEVRRRTLDGKQCLALYAQLRQ